MTKAKKRTPTQVRAAIVSVLVALGFAVTSNESTGRAHKSWLQPKTARRKANAARRAGTIARELAAVGLASTVLKKNSWGEVVICGDTFSITVDQDADFQDAPDGIFVEVTRPHRKTRSVANRWLGLGGY